MCLSRIENWACSWWLKDINRANRRILRLLLCVGATLLAGIAFLSLENSLDLLIRFDFQKILTKHFSFPYLLLFIFMLLFLGSVSLTRMAKEKIKQGELNEKLHNRNNELLAAYVELENSKQLLKKAHEELKLQSNRDPLTNINNRHYFDEIKLRIEAEARRHNWCAWAIMLDLDRLKAVNDTLGHAAGDKLLCYFAQQLSSLLRDTDHCMRIGGDEFVILGSDPHQEAVKKLAARIKKNMETWSVEIDGLNIKVAASLGWDAKQISRSNPEGDINSIIEAADARMYEEKQTRKADRVVTIKKPESA